MQFRIRSIKFLYAIIISSACAVHAMDENQIGMFSVLPNEIIYDVLLVTIDFPVSGKFCDLENCKKQTFNLLLSCKLFYALLTDKYISVKEDSHLSIMECLQQINNGAREHNKLIKEWDGSRTLTEIAANYGNYTLIGLQLKNWHSKKNTSAMYDWLNRWANPNKKDGHGNRPLYYAICNEHCPINIIRSLITEYVANVIDIDSQGRTAWQVAEALGEDRNETRKQELISMFSLK